ncbi:hypothetical protein F0562_000293 [Nyssa sinensis]|uniref:Alpha/beta hydrolase fold-3 domain-containing protein n=1 Tax=Nyssa sinensis TaxID=561372 RepID=A0A5J5C072_9ASTE|nr:hypothetical protein F0562_000293 [Nyssa sinensis]
MATGTKEVTIDLSPILRVYKDGTVERLFGSPYVPPSPEDPTTGVSSKDITISPNVSARLYLPKLTVTNQKLPILVYFHGGAFCLESAFSFLDHRYLNAIVSEAKALAVSVEYRLAPEHPLPAAYEDCWAALQWVASHSDHDNDNIEKEPWLINHGDFGKVCIGGDSAGGNIVHNIAMRAGVERLHGDVKIHGAFLSHPYFWGSEPLGSEQRNDDEKTMPYRVWMFVYPSAPGGIDNPMINPFGHGAPSLSGLGCARLLVCVAEKDELRARVHRDVSPNIFMATGTKEVTIDLSPILRVYKDGTVERLFGSPYVPPSPEDPTTGVSSKDITISPNVSARLYLPKLTVTNQKLPILVYFHGGAFCLESAFSFLDHRYLNAIVSEAKALAVSVEYRLAPEHPLPAAYEDCWAALQWVASHSAHDNDSIEKEPWLINHGDFGKVCIGGASAGGNIVHNIAMRAGVRRLHGDVKIHGAFLSHPYFWGSEPLGSEQRNDDEKTRSYRVWMFVYPSAPGGIDNPMINPFGHGAPSLSGLGCARLLVCVAEKDELRARGVCYYDAVKTSGWGGEVEFFEVQGEGHAFHIFNIDTENAKNMIKRLASFISH